MSKPGLRAALFAACLLVGLVLGLFSELSPAPLPPSAPLRLFSAGRALVDLNAIAAHPRPAGSAEAARARGALFARMQALGLHPRRTSGDAVAVRRGGSPADAAGGHVEDLIGVLDGQDPSAPVVLLMAHTDSVAASPGAADDGAGVVSALEVVRALKVRGVPHRSVGVLLTDGEEVGLLGARAFFAGNDPLRANIGAVVDLEARGGGGRTVMFETGARNGAYMRLFAGAVHDTEALSLMTAIYRVLPNDTDFTPARQADLPGYNFAFIGALADYHAPSSTVATLDKGSLQHMGDQALALTTALADAPVLPVRTPDVAFTDLYGRIVLIIPTALGWGLLLVSLGVGAWGVVMAVRAGGERFGPGVLALGLFGPLLPVLFAALLLHLLHIAMGGDGLKMRALLAEPGLLRLVMGAFVLGGALLAWRILWRGEGRLVLAGVAALAAVAIYFTEGLSLPALGLATVCGLLSLAAVRPLTPAAGWGGALLLLGLVAAGLQLAAPSVAVVALVPLVLAAAMAGATAILGRGDPGAGAAPAVLGVLALLLTVYLVRLAATTADGIGALAPEALAILVLLGAGLYPLFEGWGAKGRGFALPAPFVILVGAAVLAFALARDPFNERTPRPVEAFYLEDHRAGRAYRASSLPVLDPWSKAVLEGSAVPTLGAVPPAFDRVELSPAPLSGDPVPRIEISRTPTAGGDHVTARISGTGSARELRLFLQPAGEIFALTAAGLPLSITLKAGGTGQVRWAAPASGLVLGYDEQGEGALRLTVETITDGLPPFMKIPARGPDEAPTGRSDVSVGLSEIVIPGPGAPKSPGALRRP